MFARAVAVAASLVVGAAGAGASTGPGAIVCELEGTGEVSPGVTVVPQPFSVTIALDIACDSPDPATGAGTLTGSGSGSGGCGFSQLSGTASIDWGDGLISQMTWTSVGAARAIHVDGTFVSGPFEGRHLRVAGAIGASDPARCAGEGVEHVTFTEAGVIA